MPAPSAELSPRPAYHFPQSATQDLPRGSPAPRFEVEKPRRRSLSPMPTTSMPSSSKTMYAPPPLTLRTAFQDAKAGIHYTKDAFPTSNFLPPPFSREPVSVESGERVEVLDEVDEYAVRVRVLRTGDVGLIPLWNTEGALERLTRINTAFNEAATCPVEARALRRRDSESSAASADDSLTPSASPVDSQPLSHSHARCIPFATRVRFPDFYGASGAFDDSDYDVDSDSDSGRDSPQSPGGEDRGRQMSASPDVYHAMPGTVEQGGISVGSVRARAQDGARRKSVNFELQGARPPVVFRYPSEELVGSYLGAKPEGALGSHEEDRHGVEGEEEEDGEWWWHGWEETREEAAPEACVASSVAMPVRPMETVEEELFPFVFYEDDEEEDDGQ